MGSKLFDFNFVGRDISLRLVGIIGIIGIVGIVGIVCRSAVYPLRVLSNSRNSYGEVYSL